MVIKHEDDLDGYSSPTCPMCGSENVILEMKDGFFCVTQCKKCGYKAKESCFEPKQVNLV